MTDEEVFKNINGGWPHSTTSWSLYIQSIDVDDLIQYVRHELKVCGIRSYICNIKELGSRSIPDEHKLEVILLISDYELEK